VDGLHHRAADDVAGDSDPSPAYPVEVHGAIHRDRCSLCDLRSPGTTAVDAQDRASLPHCTDCGGLLRPDVVWFGESLDPETIGAAFAAARAADVCIVAGTSAVVHPAAAVPLATLENGGSLIEVNLETTPLTAAATVTLQGPSGEVLPALLD